MHETSFTVVSRPQRPSQAMTANRDACMYMLLPVSHSHHDNEYMVTCTDSHVHRHCVHYHMSGNDPFAKQTHAMDQRVHCALRLKSIKSSLARIRN